MIRLHSSSVELSIAKRADKDVMSPARGVARTARSQIPLSAAPAPTAQRPTALSQRSSYCYDSYGTYRQAGRRRAIGSRVTGHGTRRGGASAAPAELRSGCLRQRRRRRRRRVTGHGTQRRITGGPHGSARWMRRQRSPVAPTPSGATTSGALRTSAPDIRHEVQRSAAATAETRSGNALHHQGSRTGWNCRRHLSAIVLTVTDTTDISFVRMVQGARVPQGP